MTSINHKELYNKNSFNIPENIFRETKFIVNKNFKILSPLTNISAEFWSDKTGWFNGQDISKLSEPVTPFYVVVFPNGRKFRFWRCEYDYGAVDEYKKTLSKNFIKENWKYFEHIRRYIHISFIPQNKLTPEMCEIAVKNYGYDLRYVPNKYITIELCKIAVKNCGSALKSVPYEYITSDLCKIAVENDGFSLYDVPYDFLTPELCEIAVKNYGYALEYVPYDFITFKLCEIAVKNVGYVIFDCIPRNFFTPELCKLAVKKSSCALDFIPKEFFTPELSEIAANNPVKF